MISDILYVYKKSAPEPPNFGKEESQTNREGGAFGVRKTQANNSNFKLKPQAICKIKEKKYSPLLAIRFKSKSFPSQI